MQFPMLFSPTKIGAMEVANRFVVPPMGTNLANPDGTISDQFIAYYEARAKGGWGLLIVEVTAIDPLGKAILNEPGIWADSFIPGWRRLTDTVHRHGAKIALQLHHAGRQTYAAIIGAPVVAPSPIPCPVCNQQPHELTTKEVWELIEKFGDAAARAREAGFDAVQIHGAHGYLVAQFMSSYSNRRTDMFGGSLSNRMRFPVEVIKNIRQKCGGAYPIIFRYSADEMVPGGRTLPESRVVGRVVEEAGADALDISVGVYETMRHIIAPPAVPMGFLLAAAAEIKQDVKIPVIAVGRIHDPLLAENALATGQADLVAMGRPSLADPQLPNKVASGRLDEVCPCIGCLQGCLGRIFDPTKLTISCLMNPICGREEELVATPALKVKQVAVVGAGPGGLEAAWMAAARGHKVTLYEKEANPGGQLRTGSLPPTKQELAKGIAYWVHMAEKHGVEFKYGTEATPETLLATKPDTVIVATGAEPLIPDLKGVGGSNVVTAWDVLRGRQPAGAKVLVVGGGMVGCEAADYLAQHGRKVTVLEMLPEVALDVEGVPRSFLLERLQAGGVCVKTETKVKEITADGVVVVKDGAEAKMGGFDTVVLAMGAKPVNALKEALAGKVPEVHVLGDAVTPRKAIDAVEEGARVALNL
ncbi:MAG TPA: FAD-dependent oxidoreductase [Patescibacteria group bacterium]|nr:FAD-dependent oxidoreductase [Patescibacteria group bacterium]